jgi:hypothetical protein
MIILQKFFALIVILFAAGIVITCNSVNKKKYPSPPQYDLYSPVRINMPTELDEISGIAFYPKDTAIFAISDATGSLYKIFPNKKIDIQKWKFRKNADYEDLQLVDSVFYILSGKGNIVRLKFYTADSMVVSGCRRFKPNFLFTILLIQARYIQGEWQYAVGLCF